MNNTNDVNKKLTELMREIGAPYFIMAASHLIDVGYNSLTDENVAETIEQIKTRDDSKAFMKNDFQIVLLETALKITKAAQPLELVKFLSKHID